MKDRKRERETERQSKRDRNKERERNREKQTDRHRQTKHRQKTPRDTDKKFNQYTTQLPRVRPTRSTEQFFSVKPWSSPMKKTMTRLSHTELLTSTFVTLMYTSV